MKNIAFLALIFLSFSTFALTPRDLKCSRAGTDVLLVNGISWSPTLVALILVEQIEPSFTYNSGKTFIPLDNKSPAGSFVKFKFSYNHSNHFLRDMIESSAQKLSQNFKLPVDVVFVLAYFALNKGVVVDDFIETIITDKRLTFKNALNFLSSSLDPTAVERMIQDSIKINMQDTLKLKTSISETLLTGKKLILITESQGNLFAKQAILDFQNGELLNLGTKTGHINDFTDYIGQLQIASPTGSLLPKNRVVLNDKDIINLVFFERPASNFPFQVPDNDPRSWLDHYANHFITSTYLNDYEVTNGDLPRLREFTLQSIVDLASSLDSNCPKAVINYT